MIRVIVNNANGLRKGEFDVSEALCRGLTFRIHGDGDCGECTFEALAPQIRQQHGFTIEHRDRISIIDAAPGGGFPTLYRGLITVAGAPRSPRPSQFKAVGLRKVLYDLDSEIYQLAEGDVAAQVRQLINAAPIPSGLSTTTALIPDTGFSIGLYRPNHNSIGELLDKLTVLVPGFYVLPGTQFGNYAPGQFVPGVSWGVDKDGRIFFRRPTSASPLITEEARGNRSNITWKETSSEEVITDVRFIFGMTTEAGMIEELKTGQEKWKSSLHTSALSNTLGRSVHVQPIDTNGPLLKVVGEPWTLSRGTLISGDIEDLRNPGNSNVVVIGTDPRTEIGSVLVFNTTIPAGEQVDGFVIVRDNATEVVWAFTPAGQPYVLDRYDGAPLHDGAIYWLGEGGGAALNLGVVIRTPELPTDSSSAGEVRIRQLYPFKLDRPYLAKVAEHYYRAPPAVSGEVLDCSPSMQVAPQIRLQLETGEMLTVEVGGFDYTVTRQGHLSAKVQF